MASPKRMQHQSSRSFHPVEAFAPPSHKVAAEFLSKNVACQAATLLRKKLAVVVTSHSANRLARRAGRSRRTLASAVASEPHGAAGTRIEKSSAQWLRLNCCRCKAIRSFPMKSECRSSALAAASLSALGHAAARSTAHLPQYGRDASGIVCPYCSTLFHFDPSLGAHEADPAVVLTVTWAELKKQQSRFSRRYNGHSHAQTSTCCLIVSGG
jgi:hypothetical protein